MKRVPAQTLVRSLSMVRSSWVSTILYPGLSCILGAVLLYHLGGLPPTAWSDVARLWPQFAQDMQQGQGMPDILLLVQAGGWLIAWVSVLLMGWLALYHLLQQFFQSQKSFQTLQPQQQARLVVVPRRVVRPVPAPVQVVRGPERPPVPAIQRPEKPLVRRVEKPPVPAVPRFERPPVQAVRGPERPVVQPVRRARPTVRLAEQPTWYGEAVWNVAAGLDSGTRLNKPITEPLQFETAQLTQRRADLPQQKVEWMPSLEGLDV